MVKAYVKEADALENFSKANDSLCAINLRAQTSLAFLNPVSYTHLDVYKRQAQGASPKPVAYDQGQLEALLMDMMQDKTPVAIRFFQEQDLDQLNQQIHQDIVQLSNRNYAYGYLVGNGEWALQTCRQPEGQGYIALELDVYKRQVMPSPSTRPWRWCGN